MLVDYVARTGFATVSTNIVRELKKSYGSELKLDIVAINYFGQPYQEDENTFVISGKLNDPKEDDFGRYFFLKLLKEDDYDGVFICQDLGVIVPVIEVMDFIKKEKKEQNRKSFKSIFYFPIDCIIIEELTRSLEFFDVLVTYTEFARNQVRRFRPELSVKVIPHGNNPKDFYPLPDEERLAFRKEYFEDNAEKYIITSVNRNQPRKDLVTTILGFEEIKKRIKYYRQQNRKSTLHDYDIRDDLFLYLHCHASDPKGDDLRIVMKQTSLKEDVDYKLLPKRFEESGADVPTVNKIYNASDVVISTSLGEGWGLIFSEAVACKVPIIAPYNTSYIEMSGRYGERAYMIDSEYPCCVSNIIRTQCDIYDVADKIWEAVKEKGSENQKKKIDAAYEWSQSLDWKIVCKQWIENFKIFR